MAGLNYKEHIKEKLWSEQNSGTENPLLEPQVNSLKHQSSFRIQHPFGSIIYV